MLPDDVREDRQENDATGGKREAAGFENAKNCLTALEGAQEEKCFRRVRLGGRDWRSRASRVRQGGPYDGSIATFHAISLSVQP